MLIPALTHAFLSSLSAPELPVPFPSCPFCDQPHQLQAEHTRATKYLSQLSLMARASQGLLSDILGILSSNFKGDTMLQLLIRNKWRQAKKVALDTGFAQLLPIAESLVPYHHAARGDLQHKLPSFLGTDKVMEKLDKKGALGNRKWRMARQAITQQFSVTSQQTMCLLYLVGEDISKSANKELQFWLSLYSIHHKATLHNFNLLQQLCGPLLHQHDPSLQSDKVSGSAPVSLSDLKLLKPDTQQQKVALDLIIAGVQFSRARVKEADGLVRTAVELMGGRAGQELWAGWVKFCNE